MPRNTSRALCKEQERKTVEFLEFSFQDIESSFKKRCAVSLRVDKLPVVTTRPAQNHPSENCQRCPDAMQHLLAFILKIPPIDPSTSLRTVFKFLLRLTNDIMTSLPGYPPQMDDLQQLLDFLDDLDEAWSRIPSTRVANPRIS